MKILIDKEKLEEELNKLGQHTSYDEWEQGRKTGKIEILESILQQGEEYNENELTFLRTEVIRLMKENKDDMVIFEKEVNKVIADNENEATEFAEWILQNNIEKIKTPSQAKYWETDDTLNNKFNTTQELFKIYKDERKEKLK